jgi:small-conductance mechanosensitive channel
MDIIKSSKAKLTEMGPKIITSIIIIIVSFIIAKVIYQVIISKMVDTPTTEKEKKNMLNNRIIIETFASIIYYLVIVIGFLIALVNLGIQLSSIFVILGSVGLAIALSIQGTISNISAGLMILLLNYYDIGDLVQVNGIIGKIDRFDLFTTNFRDANNVILKFPNNMIISSVLTNYTKNEDILVVFSVKVSNNNDVNYDTLIDALKDAIEKYCTYLTNKDNIKIIISDMSESGTKFDIKIPIKSVNYLSALYLSQQIVRDVFVNNNLLLLDNSYLPQNSGSSRSMYS